MISALKIYGERNTNTNYFSKLVDLNLSVDQLPGTVPSIIHSLQKKTFGSEYIKDLYFLLTFGRNLGWKHSCVPSSSFFRKYSIVNDSLGFITITKNPYSWLLSLYKKPYHHWHSLSLTFEEFLTQPWLVLGRDNLKKKHVLPSSFGI